MSKIVYLFGAGASRNALPIVNEIPLRLAQIIEKLKNPALQLDTGKFEQLDTKENKLEIQQLMISDLEWLIDLCKTHASVDTAAKKLYLKHNDGGLKRLKLALSIFFVVEQLNSKPDFRYDAFFASLLQESITDFPKNVRIASWNYDYQFELAFQDYTNDRRVSSSQSYLNVVTKFDYDKKRDDMFSLYKLNGSTGIFKDRGFNQFMFADEFDSDLDLIKMETIVRNYAAAVYYSNQFYPSLSFAWEKQNEKSGIVPCVVHGTNDAEVLVVIGYSFPFFNRDIDRSIIGAMSHLKTVYFQAPDAENLIDRFQSIRPDVPKSSLKAIHDTNQFFLPHEL